MGAQFEAAKKVTALDAQVEGVWLGFHPTISSLSPGVATRLCDMAAQVEHLLEAETSSQIRQDLHAFVRAIRLVCHAQLVHQAVIIDQLSLALAP